MYWTYKMLTRNQYLLRVRNPIVSVDKNAETKLYPLLTTYLKFNIAQQQRWTPGPIK